VRSIFELAVIREEPIDGHVRGVVTQVFVGLEVKICIRRRFCGISHKTYIPLIIAALYLHRHLYWHLLYNISKFQIDLINIHHAMVVRDVLLTRLGGVDRSPAGGLDSALASRARPI
jgi:hypothetical protein